MSHRHLDLADRLHLAVHLENHLVLVPLDLADSVGRRSDRLVAVHSDHFGSVVLAVHHSAADHSGFAHSDSAAVGFHLDLDRFDSVASVDYSDFGHHYLDRHHLAAE